MVEGGWGGQCCGHRRGRGEREVSGTGVAGRMDRRRTCERRAQGSSLTTDVSSGVVFL